MFSRLRGGGGGYTLLAAGLACLALAGFLLALPAPLGVVLAAAVFLAGLLCIGAWWRQRQADQYDLRRLWDAPPPEPEEPYEDTLPEDAAAAPYCAWCDEAYAPGTRRCIRCGLDLG